MRNEIVRWLRLVFPDDGQLGGLQHIHAVSRNFGRLENL